jgi:hypothetical protein
MENENEKTPDERLTGNPRKDIIIYGEKNRFSKDSQPSPDAKRAGQLRRSRNRKLAQLILNRSFVGKFTTKTKRGDYVIEDTKFRNVLKEYFGLSEEELTEMSNEAAIMFRMVGSAIADGDTQAAAMMLERAYGKPKEMTPFDDPENNDDNNKPQIVIQIIQQSELPPIKEDENESNIE